MSNDKIIIKGAREHNLKNISLELPRNKLIVMTGLSGSGKSSLAFDTIYADGQRRYVERDVYKRQDSTFPTASVPFAAPSAWWTGTTSRSRPSSASTATRNRIST